MALASSPTGRLSALAVPLPQHTYSARYGTLEQNIYYGRVSDFITSIRLCSPTLLMNMTLHMADGANVGSGIGGRHPKVQATERAIKWCVF